MINAPLKTNPSDEIVLAAWRIGLCRLSASQKQPVDRQVAGFQLSHKLAGITNNTVTVSTEINRLAVKETATKEYFLIFQV